LDIKDVIHSPAKESSKINRIKELKNKKSEHEQVIEELMNAQHKLSRDYDHYITIIRQSEAEAATAYEILEKNKSK